MIEPREVGEHVVEAILANAAYVCPHPQYRAAVVARFERLLEALPAEYGKAPRPHPARGSLKQVRLDPHACTQRAAGGMALWCSRGEN